MSDDSIFRKLNPIEKIVRELPSIGKRSELHSHVKIAILIDEATKAAFDMQKEINSLKHGFPGQRLERKKDLRR